MKRREFLKSAGLVTAAMAGMSLGGPGCTGTGEPGTDAPNFLFITADNLGWQDLSSFGSPDITTPNIDRLASDGMRFTRAFVTSSSCSPSRATFLTGQYPHTNGVVGITNRHFFMQLSPRAVTLPKLLKRSGYDTALEGKWHPAVFLPAKWYGFTERFGGMAMSAEDMWITDTSRTREFLERNRDGRFYLEMNFMNNHRDPYGKMTFAEDFPVDPKDISVPDYWALPDWPEIRDDIARYYSQTMEMDRLIGEVLDLLDELDLAENTLVCFLSDNGPQMPGHIMALYDRGVRTPLLMRWPKKIPAGTDYNHLVSTVDLMPTFLDAAGLDIPDDIQGMSLMPVITRDETGPVRDAVFLEMDYHVYYIPTRGVRTERYKYLKNYSDMAIGLDQLNNTEWAHRLCELPNHPWKRPRGEEELYDLEADPDEQVNLAEDPAYAEVLEEMRGRLAAWQEETDDPFLGAPFTLDYEENKEIYEPTDPEERAYK